MSGTRGDARKRLEARWSYPVTPEERAKLAREAAETRSKMRPCWVPDQTTLETSADICKAAGYRVVELEDMPIAVVIPRMVRVGEFVRREL